MPTRPSSFQSHRGPTSIDVERLHTEWTAGGRTSGFPDEAVVGEVLNGISDDVPALEGSFLCAPHTGDLQFFEQAETRVPSSSPVTSLSTGGERPTAANASAFGPSGSTVID